MIGQAESERSRQALAKLQRENAELSVAAQRATEAADRAVPLTPLALSLLFRSFHLFCVSLKWAEAARREESPSKEKESPAKDKSRLEELVKEASGSPLLLSVNHTPPFTPSVDCR